MPKKFERDSGYSPIASDLVRSASAPSQPMHVVDGGRDSPPSPQKDQPAQNKPAPASSDALRDQMVRKKFRLTKEEDYELRDFLARVQKTCGRKVPEAILTRCAVKQLIQAETQLMEELQRSPVPDQPSTNDHVRYAEYEESWLRAVNRALRGMLPIV